MNGEAVIVFLFGVLVGSGAVAGTVLVFDDWLAEWQRRTRCQHDRLYMRTVTRYLGGSTRLHAVCADQCKRPVSFPLGHVATTDQALARAGRQKLLEMDYVLISSSDDLGALYGRSAA